MGPDGDSLGSSIALSHYLNKLSIKNKVIVPDNFPDYYNFLPSSNEVIIASENLLLAGDLIDKSDLIFCLDFNQRNRVGELLKPFLTNAEDKMVIVIDHHTYPENFGTFELIDSTASSTCELIYRFIKDNGDLDLIDPEIAMAIYTGLITDTGSFKYSSVTHLTHEIAAFLKKVGLDHTFVHDHIFDQNNLNQLLLKGYALQKIKIDKVSSLSYLALTEDELTRFQYQKGDTEGFVNYCLSIRGVKTAVFVKEDVDKIKFSFRSKGEVKVNEFAKLYYGGGGHQMAAGASVQRGDLEEVVMAMLTNYRKFINT